MNATQYSVRCIRLTLAAVCVAAVGCAPLADFRDLERKVGALDRRMQGPTDQQARLAELGEEVSELRAQLADLKGSIDLLQHDLSQGRPGSGNGAAGQGTPADGGKSSAATPDAGGDQGYQTQSPPAAGSASTGAPRGAGGGSDEVRGYEEAFRAYRSGETDQAIDRFRSFLQTYPSSAYADNAMFWLGECYFKKGDHERAVLAFEDLVKKYPSGGKVPDALYRQGLALLEMGGTSDQRQAYRSAAREIFERIVRDHASSDRAPEARRQLERLGT
jgi:tol-pal system protein YbgF